MSIIDEADLILVIVDRFTKMANFHAVKSDIIAADFVELFHWEIDLRYGVSRGIILDKDSKIISKF